MVNIGNRGWREEEDANGNRAVSREAREGWEGERRVLTADYADGADTGYEGAMAHRYWVRVWLICKGLRSERRGMRR